MVDLLEDFLCGRYRKCVQYLAGCEDGKFQPSQVQVQSNKAVCQLLMTLSSSPADVDKTLRTSLNKLENYLTQIQSFPPEMVTMETEMTIVYNSVYLTLLLHSRCSGSDDQTVLSQCGAAYSNSLARVLAAVKHFPCPSTPADSPDQAVMSCNVMSCHVSVLAAVKHFPCPSTPAHSPDQAVMSQLHHLLQYSQILQVYGVTSPLCAAGCAWSCLLMLAQKEKEAVTCLESLTQMLAQTGDASQMTVSSVGLRLCVSVHGDGVQQRARNMETLSAPDLVGLLKGLCHYKLAQWGPSRECLTRLHSDSLLPSVTYIIGLCYLKEGKADDCISVLDSARHRTSSSPASRARTLHLMGQCYAHKGLHHCAVLMFRESLQEDFNFPLALFHISEQYRQLGLEDAELESLNLLTTILEDSSVKDLTPRPVSLSSLWTSDLFQHVCPAPTISLHQSLYTLAHRCLQLHRYEDGSQRYLDLLAALSEASHLTQIDDVSTRVVDLPHIRTIYKETVECLLHAGHYEDCVIVCDKALESIRLTLNPSATSFGADNISSLLGPDDSEDLSQTISTNSRKRPRSSSCDLSLANQNEDDWQDVQHHMTLTLCKADALIALNDHDNASDSLHRAIEALLECSGRWSEVSEADIPTTSEPVPKRRRTVNDEEVLIKTETSSCPGWKSLLVQACCKFSSLLTDQGKTSDALHYSRIAVQTLPGDTRAWYTCCTALHQSGREEESCRAWLHHREVGQLSDDSHLQRELDKKQSQLRKLLTENEDTALESGDLGSRAALEMDVKSIQHMLHQEHHDRLHV
ncbi:uncharacterized protein LOC124111943 isoform X1 [Haliotis rufescens]|uniref:uncharacterized protein LOC124111943 isoform X1 n=1 Tax=Haliotis rufescens TaxID=6454 RepID=UPI00201EA8A8|nr:uncharacterized protein LOC124111943 isoform X1 [Haliotis rufescens]XP_048239962.1 uncharacterized protein LOC124111943 isoform X1 [Haliotis rufescens]XP_048239963.1 uncharacterized protein LOC124111943 isoform X1 [Haliotis rufescens]